MALVTAERLHRWKCVYCGSKDKNIVDMKAKLSHEFPEKDCGNKWANAVKIVTCNQCGKTEIFSHSALMLASILTGKAVSIEESEEFVKKFHMINHDDPLRNPHNKYEPIPMVKPNDENT